MQRKYTCDYFKLKIKFVDQKMVDLKKYVLENALTILRLILCTVGFCEICVVY